MSAMKKHVKVLTIAGSVLALVILGAYCLIYPVSSIRVTALSFDAVYSFRGQALTGHLQFQSNFPCSVEKLMVNKEEVAFTQDSSTELTFTLPDTDLGIGSQKITVTSLTVKALGWTKTLKDSAGYEAYHVILHDRYDSIVRVDPADDTCYPTISGAVQAALASPEKKTALILANQTFNETLNLTNATNLSFFGLGDMEIKDLNGVSPLTLEGGAYFNNVAFTESLESSAETKPAIPAAQLTGRSSEEASFVACQFGSLVGSGLALTFRDASAYRFYDCKMYTETDQPAFSLTNEVNLGAARSLLLTGCTLATEKTSTFMLNDEDSLKASALSGVSLEGSFINNTFQSLQDESLDPASTVTLLGAAKEDTGFLIGRVRINPLSFNNNVQAFNYPDANIW